MGYARHRLARQADLGRWTTAAISGGDHGGGDDRLDDYWHQTRNSCIPGTSGIEVVDTRSRPAWNGIGHVTEL